MEYRVLARKYRPTNFDDLIGQEALVRTLSNAITSGRIAHAFLLTGIRGIGKTTTARIIARALNCIGEDGKGGPSISPCGVCSNCKMIADDCHVDVLEMDAASHTGVEEMRDLIETVRYLPTSGRYKIYIIDEVHMLSNSAFNALLKTLEEPPPHVKFIFATTESRKIPVTILSRCQRFDLKRIDVDMLSGHLARICDNEDVKAEAEALQLIAVSAEGSVRDALSLLDQAIASGVGAEEDTKIHVTANAVRHMIGSADNTATFRLIELLLSGDINAALEELRQQYHDGADPLAIVQDGLEAVHLVTRLKVSAASASDVTLSEFDRKTAQDLSARVSMAILARLWQMLLKGVNEVKLAPSPLAALEMLMVRVAYAAQLPTPAETIRSLKHAKPEAATGETTVTSEASAAVSSQAKIVQQPAAVLEVDNTTGNADTPTTLNDFESLVALFEKHREVLLGAQLRQDVGLVAFESGKVTLCRKSNLPADFQAQISKHLKAWTGESWEIAFSEEQEDALSLHEQESARNEQTLKAASDDPMIASVMQEFPGAKVVGVKSNS